MIEPTFSYLGGSNTFIHAQSLKAQKKSKSAHFIQNDFLRKKSAIFYFLLSLFFLTFPFLKTHLFGLFKVVNFFPFPYSKYHFSALQKLKFYTIMNGAKEINTSHLLVSSARPENLEYEWSTLYLVVSRYFT